MTSSAEGVPSTSDLGPAAEARLSSFNAVFTLALILTQASSPDQVMRLVTTAVPSIVSCQKALIWHLARSGEYYQRAPEAISEVLAKLTGPGLLELTDFPPSWAFPITSPLAAEQIFLIIVDGEALSDEETFLLSVFAQLSGTVIAKLELIAAERASAQRITALNTERVAEAERRGRATLERDIARARAAELAASDARQRAILEAALDAVISIDQHACVTYVNSAFEHIFGYRTDEVTGRELAEAIIPPSLREAHRQGFARYLATGQAHVLDRRIELTAIRADGTEFPVEIAITRTEVTGDPAFTAYVRDITERQRAEHELMASRARLVAASDAARQRVTRDLHDGAQQRLVTTLINLQLAELKWESAPERARELVGLAVRDAKRGMEDLREIVSGIHPAILTQRGLAAAIGSLAAGLPISVQLDMPDSRLPPPVEASVYFFCSEALTNVVKHAHAASAWVRVKLVEDRCVVEVRDDGIGGAQPRSETSGLNGLRDRIGALNGTVDITSPATGGTVLKASIPLLFDPSAHPAQATPAQATPAQVTPTQVTGP
jgi:PAS domain S-box-containing protein